MSKTARKQAKKVPARKTTPIAKAKAAIRKVVKAVTHSKPSTTKTPTKASARTVKPVTILRKGVVSHGAKHSATPLAKPAVKPVASKLGKPAAVKPVVANNASVKHTDSRHGATKHADAKPAAVPAVAHTPKTAAAKTPAVKAAAQPAKPVAHAPAAAVVEKTGKKAAKAQAEKLEIKFSAASTPEDRQSQLKLLIARGKEQSFLTYAEVNDHLPSEIVDPEQIEDIVQMINDMGIPVYEKAPDAESLLMREPVVADDEAAEEAAAGARDHRRRRIRPHDRPGAHVHARDGHGRTADARRRNRDREAHRGRPRFRAPRAVALSARRSTTSCVPTSR